MVKAHVEMFTYEANSTTDLLRNEKKQACEDKNVTFDWRVGAYNDSLDKYGHGLYSLLQNKNYDLLWSAQPVIYEEYSVARASTHAVFMGGAAVLAAAALLFVLGRARRGSRRRRDPDEGVGLLTGAPVSVMADLQ